MKQRKLEIGNFSLGQRRDGALHTESERSKYGSPIILQSLKTIENYDIVFTDGQLRTRNGYSRWTSVALPGTPKQLYYHTNMARTEDIIFAICEDPDDDDAPIWYRLLQSATHERILDKFDPDDPDCPDPTATSPDGSWRKPIITWGDRVIFGTDSGVYWTDRDRLYDGVKYYNFGIQKPTTTLGLEGTNPEGNYDDLLERHVAEGIQLLEINNTTQKKLSSPYTPNQDTLITTLRILMAFFYDTTKSGAVRVRIETDNAGKPSGTLADTYSYTDWVDVKSIYANDTSQTIGQYTWYRFKFLGSFTLEAGTKYHIVIEPDDSYITNYTATTFFICFAYNSVAGSLTWNGSAWVSISMHFGYMFSGLDSGHIYDYAFTYFNNTYQIESRPSTSHRIQIGFGQAIKILPSTPIDPQVTHVRIYRREYEEDLGIDAIEDDIIDTYKLVGQISATTTTAPVSTIDSAETIALGAELQTFDHYCLRDPDDTNSALRGAIVPIGMVIWKGRIFAWVMDSNKLYFSKRLSESGASGRVGDMIPDYFPLDNELEIEYPSAILNAKPLSGDQLAIYFRNGSVWLLWGMDAPDNPPSEYATREQVTTIGLTACGGLTEFRGSHVYLARQGLYQFTGSQVPQYLSEFVQSILDSVSDSYIDNTRIITYGEEIWILLDEDNDGYQEVIYIFNLQKSVPCWRRYNYNVKIADFVIKSLGEQQRTIYAADATNNHILQLETGNTDNNGLITSYFETHRTKVSNARFGLFELFADYDRGFASEYEVTLYDHIGNETKIGLSPVSSDDDRGHRSGLRANARTTFSLKVSQQTDHQVDVLGFKLDYQED